MLHTFIVVDTKEQRRALGACIRLIDLIGSECVQIEAALFVDARSKFLKRPARETPRKLSDLARFNSAKITNAVRIVLKHYVGTTRDLIKQMLESHRVFKEESRRVHELGQREISLTTKEQHFKNWLSLKKSIGYYG